LSLEHIEEENDEEDAVGDGEFRN